jgi:DNA modification methylase
MIEVLHGDCLEMLPTLAADSIDACCTDPPYHLVQLSRAGSNQPGDLATPYGRSGPSNARTGFMGKTWDGGDIAFRPETWAEVYRVLKPGAHLVAFGGTRTFHRMVCAIEDAGFEIRDAISWLYASGFPKSLDVSKAIDKAAGATGTIIPAGGPVRRMIPGADQHATGSWRKDSGRVYQPGDYQPATAEAAEWDGWGTALKPAMELVCLARKPLISTVVANVLVHGTGALNIDGCMIPFADAADEAEAKGKNQHAAFGIGPRENRIYGTDKKDRTNYDARGRWPANVAHDGSDEVLAAFAAFGKRNPPGGIERFFFSAKANADDRADSEHPTVKPIALMRWLVRMITPPGGRVLDPFAGSGTTGEAAMLEGFDATLIEADARHAADIAHRIKRWSGLDAPLFAASLPPVER